MEFWRRNLFDIAGDRMLQAENYVKRLRERNEPKDFQRIL